jgi:hypothetical protein
MSTPFKYTRLSKDDAALLLDAHGLGGPLIDVLPLQEILLEFLLGDKIG